MDEAKPAATVVLLRPGASGGVEVLVERRHRRSRFAPGFVVFPGGAVEARDRALAGSLFGDPGQAARACALRELYEESGLLLTAEGIRARADRPPLEEIRFSPPSPSMLVESARWLAPEFLEVRFDARFYSVAAPRDVDPVPDGVEIDGAWWARPGEVVQASVRGEAPLMWPTLVTLEELDGCASLEEAMALRVEQVPPPPVGVQPRRGVWRRPEGKRA